MRLDRVQPRLPLGLLVLHRLDLLRPELPQASRRGRRSTSWPSIREPGVFIVDDVAFIQPEHGMAIGEVIAGAGSSKHYYLETRGDVLLRNKEVFRFVDAARAAVHVPRHRGHRRGGPETCTASGSPRTTNFEALEFARSLGIMVAINLIADPAWDEERFRVDPRSGAWRVPEIVQHQRDDALPGHRDLAHRSTQADHARLPALRHPARRVPTTLPLEEFYQELVRTQQVINRKHLGWSAVGALGVLGRNLLRGQTNFARMLWKFNSVYNLRASARRSPAARAVRTAAAACPRGAPGPGGPVHPHQGGHALPASGRARA